MIPSNITAAERICRPGASHWSRSSHTESTEKKCLILGDSISIGYQDYVTEMLEGDCIVHHAPWSGDGGSLDTRYILQCLPLLLSSSVYEPVHYDAIIFNAGLHDVDCCNYSSEYVPLKDYAKNLKKIKNTLLKTGATVAFATSTPIPYNRTRNKRVLQYNKAAKSYQRKCDGIVKKCDIFMDDQPNVHFKEWGYLFLAREVTHEFNRLLKHEKTRKQRDSKQENAPPGSLYCIKNAHGQKQDIHGLTGCPGNTTCCLNEYSNSFIGCCMLKDAMDCGDSWHCCPKGTVCDPSCTGKGCVCRKAPWESHASRTTFSLLMKSLNVFWNKIASEFP
ncbi:hypothetical protein OS493_010055 [Desmophyllum pertusum]|uniref:Granulins domain-containing protein n=1 Tax=Desmophyllum pertusum TaxID=174260 RepID=A0A9W9YEI6_9CNID|nr:hypothetical protein OS493_010055 [Desmophyllum pertusum]